MTNSVIAARCVVVTSRHLETFGTLATMTSTTFCVLPFKGLDPQDATGSGTTVAVAVGEVVAVGVGVGVSVDDDAGSEDDDDVEDCACAD